MDFLLGLILELTAEGAVYGANSRKIPFWLRTLLRVVITVVLVGSVLFFGWLAINYDEGLALRILCAVVAAAAVWFYITLLRAWFTKK